MGSGSRRRWSAEGSTGGSGERFAWPEFHRSGHLTANATEPTHAGLKVRAELDQGSYPLGVKVSDPELAAVPLRRHDWHGEWNYTVLPAAA
jgi:hypothetical protein